MCQIEVQLWTCIIRSIIKAVDTQQEILNRIKKLTNKDKLFVYWNLLLNYAFAIQLHTEINGGLHGEMDEA